MENQIETEGRCYSYELQNGQSNVKPIKRHLTSIRRKDDTEIKEHIYKEMPHKDQVPSQIFIQEKKSIKQLTMFRKRKDSYTV